MLLSSFISAFLSYKGFFLLTIVVAISRMLLSSFTLVFLTSEGFSLKIIVTVCRILPSSLTLDYFTSSFSNDSGSSWQDAPLHLL